MSFMKKIKLKYQRDEGLLVTFASLKKEPGPFEQLLNPSVTIAKKKIEEENKFLQPIDGYWIILQDWSQCSLKCGGGITVLHRMCNPPRVGGKPCVGEGIIRKPCNSQPCPPMSKINGAISKQNSTEILEPTVRVMQLSSRPQKYTKCIIKESDLLYSFNATHRSGLDIGQENTVITIPARVVMNNKTISIYAGEDYETLKDSYDIQVTVFVPSARNRYCFILRDNSKKGEFCLIGGERNKDHFDQWDYDFNLFKYQCRTHRPTVNLTAEDLNSINRKMDNIKKGMLVDREEALLKRNMGNDLDRKKDELVKTNKVALMAVEKQINLEALIEKEEREREEIEEERLRKEIEDEQEKQACALRRLKEKEIENQYNVRADEVEEEGEEIKKKAAEEIIVKRNKLKDKLRNMRKQADRKHAKLKQQLMSIRMKFNSDMIREYKKGNQENCSAVIVDKENYKNYCLRMFPNDPEKYGRCINTDNPCNTCCENEFNERYYNERVRCIKEVCSKTKNLHGGNWVWEPDMMAE